MTPLSLALLAVQAAAAPGQDSILGVLPGGVHASDSIVLNRFTPAPVVQWIFQKPPWVMWGGVVLALIVAALVLRWAWPRIPGWWAAFRAWPTASKAWLAVAGLLLLVVAAGFGWRGYDYMMNDSRFCTGCHIFVPSGMIAQTPADSGDYTFVTQIAGKHDTLNCHTCHTFHAMAEGVKMVQWMSGIRFEEAGHEGDVPSHGAVPRSICEDCHQQGDASESWQAVALTAGHRLHLESDSASGLLQTGSECLSCHAQSLHEFAPADSTCSQQGCHLTDDVAIRLGRMTEAVGAHCTVCHQFTVDVPIYASADSVRGTLRPAESQCFSCHQMRAILASFDPANDPHNGTCGMCHNPHAQVEPADALKTCADAGCHADWRAVPFHVGAAHRSVQTRCETCHSPHASRVDASDCTGCHENVRATGRHRPPVPFDTTAALRSMSQGPPVHPAVPSSALEPPEVPPRGKGDAPPPVETSLRGPDGPPTGRAVPAMAPADTFEHRRHEALACLTCHTTTSPTRTLVFEPPRGCQICHHAAPADEKCAACHEPGELEAASPTATAVVQVRGHAPRAREVAFRHDRHAAEACTTCHVTQVSLAPSEGVAACRDCHEQHHGAGVANCAACHRPAEPLVSHAADRLPGAPPAAHRDCVACHASRTVERLEAGRAFCLACHLPDVDHYAERECSTCHLQASPAELRAHLLGERPT